MTEPIKFDPNVRIREGEKEKKVTAAPSAEKFNEAMETDPKKTVAQLKKHNKSLDADSEDLEEWGKAKEDKSSLFDLSANKTKKDISNQQEQHPYKGSSLFTPQPVKKKVEEPVVGVTKDPVTDTKEEPVAAPQAKDDAIAMPLVMAEAVQTVIADVKVQPQRVTSPQELHELINKIVEHISQLEYRGKTETIVTLNHPPVFKGATLILTSFDSAKGEFNIAFENLSLKAKALIESPENLSTLHTQLESKGLVAHIITATTIEETRTFRPDAPQQRNRDDQQQSQQDNRRQQQEEQDNDE